MWLNPFFASPLNVNREAWKDRIFVLMGIVVLIAIICAVIL